jgi:hypothetical protein
MPRQSRMRYDFFDITQEQRGVWEELCPVNKYRIVPATAIPGIVPAGLLVKVHSVLVIGSATPDGMAYYMANLNRVDLRDRAIDQQPFGLAFVGTMPVGSGCLIQHGNWPGRTSYPMPDFWSQIQASGLRAYYPLTELPADPAGPVSALARSSQGSAFGILVEQLRPLIRLPKADDET